jgi:hypothetical protein
LKALALLLVATASLLLSGCPAAHSDYPSRSCKINTDCYEGEVCVQSAAGGMCATSDDGGAQ